MKKEARSKQSNQAKKELAEFEMAATRLDERLDDLGVTEDSLLAAAARVRKRMLAEVYGLVVEEQVQS